MRVVMIPFGIRVSLDRGCRVIQSGYSVEPCSFDDSGACEHGCLSPRFSGAVVNLKGKGCPAFEPMRQGVIGRAFKSD